MKTIRVEESIGHMLSHDVTQIIPNKFKGVRFKKGHIIKEEDIEVLKSIGKEHIYILDLQEDDVHENDAAQKLCTLIKGECITPSTSIKEGKIDLYASNKGLFISDVATLHKVNAAGRWIVSTIHANTPVEKHQHVAATRIIPLIIKNEEMEVLDEIIKGPFLKVVPYVRKKIGLITTGNEIYEGRIKDAFLGVMQEKVKEYEGVITQQILCRDNKEEITNAILKMKDEVDLILCTGGMSVDPDDVTPSAIVESKATLIQYGVPVLPGGMLLVAYLGKLPILGVPSCAMYAKKTVVDLVLPRVMADQKINKEDLMMYGNGGLCLQCNVCVFPRCSFGK